MTGRLVRAAIASLMMVGIATVGAAASPRAAGAAAAPTYQFTSRASGSLSGRVFTAATAEGDGSSVVLYGGETPGNTDKTIFSDTWVYQPATGWVAQCGSTEPGRSGACGPGPRSDASMAQGRTGAVLFGGSATGIDGGGGGPIGDTWVFRNGAWTQACADGACGPSGRIFAGMGGNGRQVVLFGGISAGGLADDTWVFDGTTWTQTCGSGLPTPCGSPGLLGATVGWDGTRFVMFGGAPMGASDIDAPTDATWTFDGTSWTQVCGTSISDPCGPPARALAALALQPATQGIPAGAVLVGGGNLFGADQSLERDAWLWRDGEWTQLPTPWPDTTVSFTDATQPAPGSGPLLPILVAEPDLCQVLFVGENPIVAADLTLAPQTYSGGWDLTGAGVPGGCTPTPPVAQAAAVAPTAAPASKPASTRVAMARTGRDSGPLAAVGALAIVLGLGAMIGARSRPDRRPAAVRSGVHQ